MIDLTLASRARCLLVWLGATAATAADDRLGGAGPARGAVRAVVRPPGRGGGRRCARGVCGLGLGRHRDRRRAGARRAAARTSPGRAAPAADPRAPGLWPGRGRRRRGPGRGRRSRRSGRIRTRCWPACRRPNACSAACRAAPASPEPAERMHVVRPGDTLWDIAATDLGGPADDRSGHRPLAPDPRAEPRRHRLRPRPHPPRTAAPDAHPAARPMRGAAMSPLLRRGRPDPGPGAGRVHPGHPRPGPSAAPRATTGRRRTDRTATTAQRGGMGPPVRPGRRRDRRRRPAAEPAAAVDHPARVRRPRAPRRCSSPGPAVTFPVRAGCSPSRRGCAACTRRSSRPTWSRPACTRRTDHAPAPSPPGSSCARTGGCVRRWSSRECA